MQRTVITMGVVAGALALAIGGLCVAQPPQGGQGPGGFGGPGGQFDPAQMRQRMMQMWQEQLGADDDAWKVIEPPADEGHGTQPAVVARTRHVRPVRPAGHAGHARPAR